MTYFVLKSLPVMIKDSQGFTLLELLVALAIFAIMATMAYSSLNTMINTHLQTERLAEQLAQLQTVFIQLKRDLEQSFHRPIRDEYGDVQPAFLGTEQQLEFSRAGWRNPTQQARSSLQRVAYYRENNTLWRIHWLVLDRAQENSPHRRIVLNEVKDLQWRFLDHQQQWHEQWPPLNFPKPELAQLQAVEVTLTFAEWGHLTWLFSVLNSELIEK